MILKATQTNNISWKSEHEIRIIREKIWIAVHAYIDYGSEVAKQGKP